MVTVMVLAWLVPCVPVAGRLGGALRRTWTSRRRRAAVSLPRQRRGD
jgi:hypothetical protein